MFLSSGKHYSFMTFVLMGRLITNIVWNDVSRFIYKLNMTNIVLLYKEISKK